MTNQSFFLNFFDVATVATIHKRKTQIWLQIREDSRQFLEFCYVLASMNPVSKYGNFHVFLLRMWQTKEMANYYFVQNFFFCDDKKEKCHVDAKFCTK
jgi:hypothetical protein